MFCTSVKVSNFWLKKKKEEKGNQEKKKGEKEKKNAVRIFLMKEEIITAHIYVIKRVLSTRTKKNLSCLPIKEDRMGNH